VAPPSFAEEVAKGIITGGGKTTAAALKGVAHLAPAEAPGLLADIMRKFIKAVA